MKTILSYGAGVNSTAIIALAMLGKFPMPDYIVFSDTGAEWPHTYKYMDYMESKGIGIIYLEGGTKNMTLIEWCQKKSFIPSRMNRWCTDYWKIQPVRLFAKGLNEETETILGIDMGEAHRAERTRYKDRRFPLIELGLDRNGCKKSLRKPAWESLRNQAVISVHIRERDNGLSLKSIILISGRLPLIWRRIQFSSMKTLPL